MILRAAGLAALLGFAAAAACGESRRPIGDECIRNEDCLSSVCAARVCSSAPSLVTGASNPPGQEEPRIPDDASLGPAVIRDASASDS